MKYAVAILGICLSFGCWAGDEQVYLLSKRQIVNSHQTIVVLFHDTEVTTLDECRREIQRGIREQWRFYQHRFPRPVGYSENKDYLCIKTRARIEPWLDYAPYDHVYQIDLRRPAPVIKKMPSLAKCLNDLRKVMGDESRTLFCGKLSQKVSG